MRTSASLVSHVVVNEVKDSFSNLLCGFLPTSTLGGRIRCWLRIATRHLPLNIVAGDCANSFFFTF
jgi:hypothetical protein